MFFFSKSKKEEPEEERLIVDNPILGRMEHIYDWWSLDRINVCMFGKTYSVKYVAASDNSKIFPNAKQEDAFKKVIAEKEKWQNDVEQAVIHEIKLDPPLKYKDVINVEDIHISQDGAFGISMAINYNYLDVVDLDELGILPHNCFGVSIYPELYVVKCEDDFDQLFM